MASADLAIACRSGFCLVLTCLQLGYLGGAARSSSSGRTSRTRLGEGSGQPPFPAAALSLARSAGRFSRLPPLPRAETYAFSPSIFLDEIYTSGFESSPDCCLIC